MNRIKELRTKLNLSLRNLQKFTGIDFSRLAVLEKTDGNMETKTIEKLCNFFNVSSNYLLGNDGYIYYYDINNHKFGMLYDQFKEVLTEEVVIEKIINNIVVRTITLEGYERLDKTSKLQRQALNNRIAANHFIEYLNNLDETEYKQVKEAILDYFECRN